MSTRIDRQIKAIANPHRRQRHQRVVDVVAGEDRDRAFGREIMRQQRARAGHERAVEGGGHGQDARLHVLGCERVTERFDPEGENPHDMQRMGWQMILDRFAAYASSL